MVKWKKEMLKGLDVLYTETSVEWLFKDLQQQGTGSPEIAETCEPKIIQLTTSIASFLAEKQISDTFMKIKDFNTSQIYRHHKQK